MAKLRPEKSESATSKALLMRNFSVIRLGPANLKLGMPRLVAYWRIAARVAPIPNNLAPWHRLCFPARRYAVATGSRTGSGSESLCGEPHRRWSLGRFMDRSHQEHRWKCSDGSRVLSRLLLDRRHSVSGRDLRLGGLLDHDAAAEPNGHLPSHGPHDRLNLQGRRHRHRHPR